MTFSFAALAGHDDIRCFHEYEKRKMLDGELLEKLAEAHVARRMQQASSGVHEASSALQMCMQQLLKTCMGGGSAPQPRNTRRKQRAN